MSKGLSSYPEERRKFIALRRVKTPTKGNGYWAAVAYLESIGHKWKSKKSKRRK